MLTVITGPMFAGKTSTLIALIEAHKIAGQKVLAFKPHRDDRYNENAYVTHDGQELAVQSVESLDEVFIEVFGNNPNVDVVCFDEGQFFNPADLIKTVEMLTKHDYSVVVAGLAQDSFGKPFGAMPQVMAMADRLIPLSAVCVKCKSIGAATRTHRKCDSTEQVVVGGKDIYEPRCFRCWREED